MKKIMKNHRVTVFTPTYNREKTLHRVYESLLHQTFKDFEWLVIDDGSTDNTKELINKYIKEGKIDIRYFYQENQGKHIAINNAVQKVNSELFLIADSDDAFLPESLDKFVETWDSIENKALFKGVIARCFDSVSKKKIGNDFPMYQFDANELDANFKYKTVGEKWSLFKTDVLREFPFPNINGLKFYPETIIWQKMARKYLTRYIDIPLREYFKDQDNALTNKRSSRYKENIYLWEHIINNIYDYFWYNPKLFLKAHVGISRDGLLNNKKFKDIVKMNNKFYKKVLTIILYPLGYFLYKRMINNE